MGYEKIKFITEYPNEDEFWGRFYALIHELAEDVRRKNGTTNKVQDNRPKDNNRPSREKKATRKAL
jgi:hypothetical protein